MNLLQENHSAGAIGEDCQESNLPCQQQHFDCADTQQIGAQWCARSVGVRARYQNEGCGVTHPHTCSMRVYSHTINSHSAHDFQSGSHPTGWVSRARASIHPASRK